MRFLVRPITILRDFLTWWVAELAALVPEAIRRRFRAVRPILLLETSRQRVRFRLFRGQRCSDLGTVKLSAAGTAEERAEVTAITERVDLRTSDVALRLPADAALRRSLTMPLAAESDLRQAIGFQLDRQTPFSPQEACFDYQVRDRSPARQSLTVDLTVVPRQALH